MLSARTPQTESAELVKRLTGEMANFEEIAERLLPRPGEVPILRGIDIHGGTRALNGIGGGDHLIYVDFEQRFDLEARIATATAAGRLDITDRLARCQRRAGIALIDVSGHRITDALLAAMMHQAFLLGATYELDQFGEVTRRLFENLNTRFYHTSGAHKFISLLYGEISEDARFRFLAAAQPLPMVFSRAHQRFMDVAADKQLSFPPLGIVPSLDLTERSRPDPVLGAKDKYQMNEWTLMGEGDLLLLFTDGLCDYRRGDEEYFPTHAEQLLRRIHGEGATAIFNAVMTDLEAFGPAADDVSLVVIKRTSPGSHPGEGRAESVR